MTTPEYEKQETTIFLDPNLICFREHEMNLLVEYAVQRVIRDLIILYAREINLRKDGRLPSKFHRVSSLSGKKDDCLDAWRKREWITCSEIMQVYGFSRYTVRKIVKDSHESNIEVKVAILSFHHGTKSQRTRPFILINKKSLDEYLTAHCEAGGHEDACFTQQAGTI